MISRDVLDYQLTVPDGTQTVHNRFLYKAEEAFPVLQMVYDKQLPMFSDMYSILANTFERMYKGVYLELYRLKEIHKEPPNSFNREHHFISYVREINRVIPIAGSREGYFSALQNLERISEGYTGAKFYDVYGYNDFEKDFRRLEIQRKRVYAGLEQILIKHNLKEVREAEDISKDDLDLYEI